MTRVAGANPRIWVDIFLENRERSPRRSPSTGAASSRSRRRSRPATQASSRAGSARPPPTGGACSRPPTRMPAQLQRLRVHIPDRPGVIAGIAQALGAERINIADFDLQHLSSERGGTLAILVAGRGGGGPRGRAPRAAGLRRRRRARARGRAVKIAARAAVARAHRRPRGQVDLRTARCCSAAICRGRDADRAASAARPTRSRRSAASRALGPRSTRPTTTRCASSAAGCAASCAGTRRSTAATPAR